MKQLWNNAYCEKRYINKFDSSAFISFPSCKAFCWAHMTWYLERNDPSVLQQRERSTKEKKKATAAQNQFWIVVSNPPNTRYVYSSGGGAGMLTALTPQRSCFKAPLMSQTRRWKGRRSPLIDKVTRWHPTGFSACSDFSVRQETNIA